MRQAHRCAALLVVLLAVVACQAADQGDDPRRSSDEDGHVANGARAGSPSGAGAGGGRTPDAGSGGSKAETGEGSGGSVAATSSGAAGGSASSPATESSSGAESSSTAGAGGSGPSGVSSSPASNAGGQGGLGAGGTAATGGTPAVGGLGAGGSAQTCDDGTLQCNADSGLRERCDQGAWVPTDFVCALSIRVDINNGATCAVKTDGTVRCWTLGGSQFATDVVAPPGVLKAAHPFGSGAVVWLLADGTFVDDAGSETPGVSDFDVAGNDVCLVYDDGTADCSRSGTIEASPVVRLALSASMRCVLLESGEAFCDDWRNESYALDGPYVAIAAAYQVLCAVDAAGAVTCIELTGTFADEAEPTLTTPLAGVYEKIAMTDTTVCAISQEGSLDCTEFSGDGAMTLSGRFVDLDGGDFTLAAIRADGSVASWVNQMPVELPSEW